MINFFVFELLAKRIRASLRLSVFLPLLAAALGATWYGLFWSVDHFAALTDGLSFMDMQPRLTRDELFVQVGSYGPKARVFYFWWSLFDYAWPFLTFTTMLFITPWLFRFLGEAVQDRFRWLVAFAYITVLFDWAENLGFVSLVLAQPSEPAWLASITLAMHAGKLLFNMLFNLGFFMLLLIVLVTVVRRRTGFDSQAQ